MERLKCVQGYNAQHYYHGKSWGAGQGGTGVLWLGGAAWRGESWAATLRMGWMWVIGEQEGASQALEGSLECQLQGHGFYMWPIS